jgi:hypothetical protein
VGRSAGVRISGKGTTFEIGVHDGGGRLIRLLRRAYDPRPVTADLRSLLGDWYVDLVSTSSDDRILGFVIDELGVKEIYRYLLERPVRPGQTS